MINSQLPLIVAVCGDSGSGKTTLTDGMVRVFGQERITHICLDDYHILDRAARMRAGITPLNPAANNFALMTEHIRFLSHGQPVVKPVYDHKTGTFGPTEEVYPSEIIIVHGLHPLYTEELRNLAHVRIYLDPEPALRHQWKIIRDSTSRGYTVEQVLQEIAARERDSYLYIHPQKQFADIIIRFSRPSVGKRPSSGASQHKSPNPTSHHSRPYAGDPAHLNVRLIEGKHTPKIDLTDVLEVSQNGLKPALRFAEEEYEGTLCDVMEIDGDISHEKACELEDRIWSHMEEASHLRPDSLEFLGLFHVGNELRQSDPLALTQLITLYHVISARSRMKS